jgi:hypothetical protein
VWLEVLSNLGQIRTIDKPAAPDFVRRQFAIRHSPPGRSVICYNAISPQQAGDLDQGYFL